MPVIIHHICIVPKILLKTNLNLKFIDMKKHLKKILIKTSILWVLLLASGSAMGQGWLKTYQEQLGDTQIPFATKTADGMLLFTAPEAYTNDPIKLIKVDDHGEVILEKQYQSSYENLAIYGLKGLDDGTFLLLARTSIVVDTFEQHHVTTIAKLDSLANKLWEVQIPIESQTIHYHHHPMDATIASNGDIIVSGIVIDSNFTSPYLVKISSYGDLIWEKTFSTFSGTIVSYNTGHGIVEDGNIVLASSSGAYLSLIKTDSVGNFMWEKIISDSSAWLTAFAILKDTEGDILFAGRKEYPLPEPTVPYAIKVNSNGEVVWEFEYNDLSAATFKDAVVAMDGGYYLCGDEYFNGHSNLSLAKMNLDGSLAWYKTYNFGDYDYSDEVFQYSDGSIGITGRIGNFSDAFIAKTTPLGVLYSSAISGNIHNDLEIDCEPDAQEADMSGWLVQAIGSFTFSQLSDEFGNYLLPIDTGNYEVKVAPPGPYWDICNNPTTINVTAFYDTTLLDFPVQADEECPYLEVSLTTPFLRRCFDNTYTVQYCNYGTVPAEDAYVEVTLDTFLAYQSSTIPLVSQNGNTLTFDLGDVEVSQCGSFGITAYLDCDNTVLGQTHCTEAHIFPDSLCIPTSPLWDGSNIELDVECVGDSVIFNIQNTGSGDMSQPLNYIIIEDQIVLFDGTFQLEVGETMNIAVFANGTTFHLEAEQSFYHPSGNVSTGVTVEGCGGWFSLGFFTQYANPDDSPFIDIDCQENVGSFDPNDKQASPVGFGEEHLIEPQTELEYLIRFQNTGTDTAFNVVVVDVLPVELDLASLRPGASSHPYEYTVSPEGWPMFTFKDIMLPDSNVNEAASHGFVKFKISQREVNSNGTLIKNSALIYFDFNSPIQTNSVVHKVGQVFPWTIVGTIEMQPIAPTLRIFPNPVTERATLFLENMEAGMLRLLLVDPKGQVLRDEKKFGTGFEFLKAELPPGIYFFKIEKDGKWISSGKLIIQ